MKRIIIIALIACFFIQCGNGSSGGSGGPKPPSPPESGVAVIKLTPDKSIANTGNTISLVARAFDTAGQGVEGIAIVFTSNGAGTLNTNYQITDSQGYAYASVYSSAAGQTTITALTNTLSSSLDVYFVDGDIANTLSISVDRNGNGIYDEQDDFIVSGGESVRIRVNYTNAAGVPLPNKTIALSADSSAVTLQDTIVVTDNEGHAYTSADFSYDLENAIYVGIIATSEDGITATVTLQLQAYIVGDILLTADKYTTYAGDVITLTACLISDMGSPIEKENLMVNFTIDPSDAGNLLPFAFTGADGCATNTLNTLLEGDITVEASFAGVEKTLTLTITKIVGDIVFYADDYLLDVGDVTTLYACLIGPDDKQVEISGLRVNFSVDPVEVGTVTPPSVFTDAAGCVQSQFEAVEEGIAGVTASFADIQKTISIGVNTAVQLTVIPENPVVEIGDTVLIMVTGGVPPYTVTSLNPSLTDPDNWTVNNSGDTFSVTGMAEGTATLVVSDSASNTLPVELTVNP